MKRIAILGGGIAGISAAYEIARQQRAGAPLECVLLEAANRLGGIVETIHRDGFILECGPDSWVTEKPEARNLAVELGLESDLIFSRDERRRTYLADGEKLRTLPDRMRMMVPMKLAGVLTSATMNWRMKFAYLREPRQVERLKAGALAADPTRDESVRDFVVRHFGAEVAGKLAAPLLAGVFGGDIGTLSARAVLPAYVALEREHGSLILGLRQRTQADASKTSVFTTLRNGVGGLVDGMASHIPARHIRYGHRVDSIERAGSGWRVYIARQGWEAPFDAVFLATPAKATVRLLAPLGDSMAKLLPEHSSSAIVVNLGFTAEQSKNIQVPRGFGFLMPQRGEVPYLREDSRSHRELRAGQALLACTFADQKFLHRVPSGARLLRAFFGGPHVESLLPLDDDSLVELARTALQRLLGKLPEPAVSLVRRLPDSLPLYAVGHLERVAELETRARQFPHLRFLGNAYRGVGLPDLIGAGRRIARETISELFPA